jgi:hypothetical protein
MVSVIIQSTSIDAYWHSVLPDCLATRMFLRQQLLRGFEDPDAFFLVAEDLALTVATEDNADSFMQGSGQLVGFCKWVRNSGSLDDQPHPAQWPLSVDPEFMKHLTSSLCAIRVQTMGKREHWYFHSVCSHLEHDGGVANVMLLEEVTRRADAERMPIYAETQAWSQSIFEGVGFHRTQEVRFMNGTFLGCIMVREPAVLPQSVVGNGNLHTPAQSPPGSPPRTPPPPPSKPRGRLNWLERIAGRATGSPPPPESKPRGRLNFLERIVGTATAQ